MSDGDVRPPMTLADAQAENGLMHELFLVAMSDHRSARRMQSIAGFRECEVVESYLQEHPEIKRWADSHIAARTCERAISEIREEREYVAEARKKQREDAAAWAAKPVEERCEPPPEGTPDWMKPFALGPAKFPPPFEWPERKRVGAPKPKPPFDFNDARARLTALKVSGHNRMARAEAITELRPHYSAVPRRQVDELLKKVWGEGKAGPRALNRRGCRDS